MKGLGRSKIYSHAEDDPWVQVRVAGYEGVSKDDSYAFRRSAIQSVRSIGDAHSVIKTNEKEAIILHMPQAMLLEALHQSEGPVVDLREKTLLINAAELIKSIKEEERRRIEREKEASVTSLLITTFARASQKSDFVQVQFSGDEINIAKLEEGGSIHGGHNIRVRLYDNAQSETPFADKAFIIEGRLEEFRRLCLEAYQRGDTALDISDYSMQKFKDQTPAARRAEHERQSQR